MSEADNSNLLAPRWLLQREGITQRQWKSRKRRELKAIIKAFENYRMGCAYCPGTDGEVGELQHLLERLKDSHSVKKWGR